MRLQTISMAFQMAYGPERQIEIKKASPALGPMPEHFGRARTPDVAERLAAGVK